MRKEITIIGAGLVGSLLSLYLLKKGYKVKVFERRADMRKATLAAGRSINLALSDRGIRALEEVGIMDEIRKIAIPMNGRFIHNADGTNAYQAYGKEGQFINSVSRGDLNKKLVDLAETKGAEFIFNHKCERVDWEKNEINFTNTGDAKHINQSFDMLFGTDGAYSATRLQHQLQHDRFQYSQFYIDFGYKELMIPAGGRGEFQMEKNALHIWPRGNYMLIALPNMDGSFTCTFFFPFEGEPSFESLDTKEKVKDFFVKTFPDATAFIPTLEGDYFNNPVSSLVTVKCFPWIRNDRFALLGDAAHAIVPFFGQGMNCGFEDCRVLNQLMDCHGDDWTTILHQFQEQRKPDADAIADLALNNFAEMRDRVGDPQFLLQKKIESKLNSLFPDKWVPVYSFVTFSPDTRYSEALTRGSKQELIMREIMKTPGIENEWQSETFLKSIIEKL